MRMWLSVLAAVAWMLLIITMSSLPGERLGPDILPLDVLKKAGHVGGFGILAVLCLHALNGGRPLGEAGADVILLSFFLVVLFAITDEYHQSFTPGRHASGIDVFIDSCGAIVFLGFLYRVKAGVKIMRKEEPVHGKTADYRRQR